jgi:F-type H+-transporting ATPase subunit delta
MAETITIARPYGRAAFEYAQARKGGLKKWSEMLSTATAVVHDPAMQTILDDPARSSEEKAGILLEICGEALTKAGSNFIKLLAENRRLNLLPDILEAFEELRAEAEKTVDAEMISAFPVDDAQLQQISQALSSRLQREVNLSCTVDETLLGGAIIRAGDLIIDGSAQGALDKLATALRQ